MKPATKALLLSLLVFPGLGQLHQKRPAWGWLFIGLTILGLVLLGGPVLSLAHELSTDIVSGKRALDPVMVALEVERRGLADAGAWPALLLLVTWIGAAIDAWRAGRKRA